MGFLQINLIKKIYVYRFLINVYTYYGIDTKRLNFLHRNPKKMHVFVFENGVPIYVHYWMSYTAVISSIVRTFSDCLVLFSLDKIDHSSYTKNVVGMRMCCSIKLILTEVWKCSVYNVNKKMFFIWNSSVYMEICPNNNIFCAYQFVLIAGLKEKMYINVQTLKTIWKISKIRFGTFSYKHKTEIIFNHVSFWNIIKYK